MASINNEKKRFVIPIWRSYTSTFNTGELNPAITTNNSVDNCYFANYVNDWKKNKNIGYAGDLLSAAIAFGIPMSEHEELKKVSDFILNHSNQATPLLLSLTERYIGNDKTGDNNCASDKETILSQLENKFDSFRQDIRHIKKRLTDVPYNPISYCELSRCYFCMGQLNQAIEAMNRALYLTSNSRYITRSAARFFAEREDFERARYIVAHNPSVQQDPWMMATEIALNACMNRSSKYIKKGREIVASQSFSNFSISELSSSIATIENYNGRHRETKRLLQQALIDPNDNSLAQARWMQEVSKDLNLQFRDYDNIVTKYEADFWYYYDRGDYEKALMSALLWCKDMPFAIEPIYKASNIAYACLQDYQTAVRILKVGVRLQPHDLGMLNNLAYSYALDDKVKEAEDVFNSIPTVCLDTPSINGVCLTATKGLIEYRKNNIHEGRTLYAKAIKDAESFNLPIGIRSKAVLNFIREEAGCNPDIDSYLLKAADSISTGNIRETELLRAEIKKSAEKAKRSKSKLAVIENHAFSVE